MVNATAADGRRADQLFGLFLPTPENKIFHTNARKEPQQASKQAFPFAPRRGRTNMLRRAACLLLPRPAAPHSATSTSASLLTPLTTWVRHLPTMKRRFRGLYGGKHIQFGNQISFSHRKSRRLEAQRAKQALLLRAVPALSVVPHDDLCHQAGEEARRGHR